MKYLTTALFILFLLFQTQLLMAAPDKLTLALSDEANFPAHGGFGTEYSENPGLFIETTKIIGKDLLLIIEYERMPWKRCLKSMEIGDVDGVLIASYKPEREKLGVYPKKNGKIDISRRFSSSSYYMYVPIDSPVTWNGKYFGNIYGIIGAQLGFSIVTDLEDMGLEVATFKSVKQTFDVMFAGRIDGVASHADSGNFIWAKNTDKIKRLEPFLKSKPYYMMLSHQFVEKYPKYSEIIWNAVSKARDSNELKLIRNRYFQMESWPGKKEPEKVTVPVIAQKTKTPEPAQPDKSVKKINPSEKYKDVKLIGLLYEGLESDYVLITQEILTSKGFYDGPIQSYFSPKLLISVRAFQKEKNLSVDGLVGPKTWKALLEKPSPL